MTQASNEATSLIIQVLNLADPNPPEKAAERVEQMRKLLNDAADKRQGRDVKRQASGGFDRKQRGGSTRGE